MSCVWPVSRGRPRHGKHLWQNHRILWLLSGTGPGCRCSRVSRWPRRPCAPPRRAACPCAPSVSGRLATWWCHQARRTEPRWPGPRKNWKYNGGQSSVKSSEAKLMRALWKFSVEEFKSKEGGVNPVINWSTSRWLATWGELYSFYKCQFIFSFIFCDPDRYR